MVNKTLTGVFTEIADAIREKKGSAEEISVNNFANEIISISAGNNGASIPVLVYANAGTTITAVNNADSSLTSSVVIGDEGKGYIYLPSIGVYNLTAALGDITKGPSQIEVKPESPIKFKMDSILPAGYTEVEYIEFTGSQSILTAGPTVYNLYSWRLVFDIELTQLANCCIYGGQYSGNSTTASLRSGATALIGYRDGELYFFNGGVKGSTSAPGWSKNGGVKYFGGRCTLICDVLKKEFSVNGEVNEDTSNLVQGDKLTNSNCGLGGLLYHSMPSSGSASISYNSYAKMKLYSFEYYNQAGELKGEYIPCKKGDQVGLYNTVGQYFKTTDSGKDAVIAGPEV